MLPQSRTRSHHSHRHPAAPARWSSHLLVEKEGDADRAAFNLVVREACPGRYLRQTLGGRGGGGGGWGGGGGATSSNDGEQGRPTTRCMSSTPQPFFEGIEPAARSMAARSSRTRRTAQASSPRLSSIARASGPVAWQDFAAPRPTSRAPRPAMVKGRRRGYFMTSPSPGQIARYPRTTITNRRRSICSRSPGEEARIQGEHPCWLILHADCPDLAMSYGSIPASALPSIARSSRRTSEALITREGLPGRRMRMPVLLGLDARPAHG